MAIPMVMVLELALVLGFQRNDRHPHQEISRQTTKGRFVVRRSAPSCSTSDYAVPRRGSGDALGAGGVADGFGDGGGDA
ncbi:hypothetical protein, partial [Nocardia sp. JMUB6875]|uniref:hypothetical protein n=1 Tax=Nocardia sp. JMUB6875 TaxID=3158170 RepID=UPI0034E88C89